MKNDKRKKWSEEELTNEELTDEEKEWFERAIAKMEYTAGIVELCKIVDSNYYYDVSNDEEHLHNLCIELCVERFVAERIDLTGWVVSDHLYSDDEIEIYSFYNMNTYKSVDFEILKDDTYGDEGYVAIPLFNEESDGGFRAIRRNKIADAIQKFEE